LKPQVLELKPVWQLVLQQAQGQVLAQQQVLDDTQRKKFVSVPVGDQWK
jgi:hypothetical protein